MKERQHLWKAELNFGFGAQHQSSCLGGLLENAAEVYAKVLHQRMRSTVRLWKGVARGRNVAPGSVRLGAVRTEAADCVRSPRQ